MVVSAHFNIGKVVASLPMLIDDLFLSLTEAGWVVSLFYFDSRGRGCADRVAGRSVMVRRETCRYRFDYRALGSFAGASADSFSWLIVTRLVEGLGFIMTIVSCPSLDQSLGNRSGPAAGDGLMGQFLAGWRRVFPCC